jgi:mono/diheme cytochrome c family protein
MRHPFRHPVAARPAFSPVFPRRFGMAGAAALMAAVALGPVPASAAGFADVLLFDATMKEQQGTAGQTNFLFTFAFTNAAPGPVVIESVRTSCGCTVAKVPALPWTVPPGGDGEFSVALDARGKRGTVTKSVFVNTSMGVKPLTVRAIIDSSSGGMDDRVRNMQIALADRGAIFRGECATCHVKPAVGKMGVPLYLAACGICHDSHNRASMVPDLRRLPHPTDRDHWIRWISFGRHGSLMPAFAQAEGGPLTEAQIDSLADYLTRTISQRQIAQSRPAARPDSKVPLPPLPGIADLPPASR